MYSTSSFLNKRVSSASVCLFCISSLSLSLSLFLRFFVFFCVYLIGGFEFGPIQSSGGGFNVSSEVFKKKKKIFSQIQNEVRGTHPRWRSNLRYIHITHTLTYTHKSNIHMQIQPFILVVELHKDTEYTSLYITCIFNISPFFLFSYLFVRLYFQV